MWIADKWNDYEVLDCSDGEKLERWGTYCLVRPDPQASKRSLSPEQPGRRGMGVFSVAGTVASLLWRAGIPTQAV